MASPSANFTCPAGGSWYACGIGSRFVGCCASDPCDRGCSEGNIQPVTFEKELYGLFPDASCGSNSNFYTCLTTPPFWGCCKSNPCAQAGCPSGDLVPAFMDRPEQFSHYSASGISTTLMQSTTSTQTPTPSSLTLTTPTTTVTGGVTVGAVSTEPVKGVPTAAIAGGVAGGVVVLLILIGLLMLYVRRSKKTSNELKGHVDHNQTLPARVPSTEKHGSGFFGPYNTTPIYPSPTPTYTSQFQLNAHQIHELPATLPTPNNYPLDTKNRRHLSELSSDTIHRLELESPLASPKSHISHSPRSPEHRWSTQVGHSRQNSDSLVVWPEQPEWDVQPGKT